MQLINFKEDKQREILKLIGEKFIQTSEEDYAENIEHILMNLQTHFFDPLAEDDFFGTEGWEHWLGLD
jgi:hypothetical protein